MYYRSYLYCFTVRSAGNLPSLHKTMIHTSCLQEAVQFLTFSYVRYVLLSDWDFSVLYYKIMGPRTYRRSDVVQMDVIRGLIVCKWIRQVMTCADDHASSFCTFPEISNDFICHFSLPCHLASFLIIRMSDALCFVFFCHYMSKNKCLFFSCGCNQFLTKSYIFSVNFLVCFSHWKTVLRQV